MRKNAESYGCRAWRVNDEQSLLAALEASRAHPGPTLLDIKVLPKTMTHDYASWWRTGDAQVAASSAVREAAEQTQAQVKKPASIEFSCRNEIFISFLFSPHPNPLPQGEGTDRCGFLLPLPEGEAGVRGVAACPLML